MQWVRDGQDATRRFQVAGEGDQDLQSARSHPLRPDGSDGHEDTKWRSVRPHDGHDYSRFVTIQFLSTKNEKYDCLVEYRAMMEKQVGVTLKCFRTDKGGEFVNKRFRAFCVANGIVHQTTVPVLATAERAAGADEQDHRRDGLRNALLRARGEALVGGGI